MLPRTWESPAGKRQARIAIDNTNVVLSSDCGPGGAPVGAVLSHEEFLDGKYHDVVRKTFGEQVLQEMLKTTRTAHTT